MFVHRRALLSATCAVILAFSISGCAISVKLPANRFDSPETSGKLGRIALEAGIYGQNEMVLTDDFEFSGPDTWAPHRKRSRDLQFKAGVGLADRFDVQLKTPAIIQAKYQFIGDSRLNAKEGNISLAVTAAAGRINSKESATPLFSAGETRTVDMDETLYDSALIVGYRFDEMFMAYTSGYISTVSASGTYAIEKNAVAKTTGFAGTAHSRGINLGVEIGDPAFQLRLEGAYTHTEMGASSWTRPYFGANVSAQFN